MLQHPRPPAPCVPPALADACSFRQMRTIYRRFTEDSQKKLSAGQARSGVGITSAVYHERHGFSMQYRNERGL